MKEETSIDALEKLKKLIIGTRIVELDTSYAGGNAEKHWVFVGDADNDSIGNLRIVLDNGIVLRVWASEWGGVAYNSKININK